ncbi:MAG TPA: hypothetical protein VJ738_07670 [Steroidobacteraceae bacterium]|nr:hypothetical protein [Steroidobacteraceae bacterium]
MSITNYSPSVEGRPISAGDVARFFFWLLWQCVRVPALLLLAILEPVVSFVLSALALLGVLTALFWKLVGPPNFPFFLVLGISLGFEFALVLYYALLRLLGAKLRLCVQ